MSHRVNVERITAVYNALGPLRDKVVFVGGAVVSLYADRMADEVRPTLDVDILIELWRYAEFAAIEEQLRKMGFRNDPSSKFTGRYLLDNLQVDVMPTDEKILGFTNKWYQDGLQHAINHDLNGMTIKIFTAPYFIASKLEAFFDRGKNEQGELDGRLSSDFEDMVFILDNRDKIWEEMHNAPSNLRQYLHERFTDLLTNLNFEEWVFSHTPHGSPPSGYYIIEQLKRFTGNG